MLKKITETGSPSDVRIRCGMLSFARSEALIQKRGERLRQEVEALLPMYNLTVEHAWVTMCGESNGQLPFIGEYPHRLNLFY